MACSVSRKVIARPSLVYWAQRSRRCFWRSVLRFQALPRKLQSEPLSSGSLLLKLAAYRLERLTGKQHHMELIEDDLSPGKIFGRSLQIGRTHVHGNSPDLGWITAMLAQCLGKGAERFATASFDHQQQTRTVAIQHVGHVTVPPPGAGLIDGDPAYSLPIASCLGLLDVMDQHSP